MTLQTGSWQLANFLHAIQSSKVQRSVHYWEEKHTRYNNFMEQAMMTLLTGSWLSCINFLHAIQRFQNYVTADCHADKIKGTADTAEPITH